MVQEKKQVFDLLPYTDAFLFGLDGFSRNFGCYYTLEELKELVFKLDGKEVFISINKNIHEKDLPSLRELLKSLNQLPIKGIYYYDAALVTMKQEGLIQHPLIWHQEHLTTNYETCNFWKNLGVKGTCLSSEITLEEILEIKKNTDMDLIVPIFGYISMFVSKRNLVRNYLETFSIEEQGSHYKLEKEGSFYPIVNDKWGTQVYSSRILNGLSEMLILKKAGISYVLLNGFQLNPTVFQKILNCYNSVTEENKKLLEQEISLLLDDNIDKGFLYKETVYRVKK